MNINASLIAEMFAFGLFIWLTMKFVWPPITKAMADREQKIADGLAAGERGRKHQRVGRRGPGEPGQRFDGNAVRGVHGRRVHASGPSTGRCMGGRATREDSIEPAG